MPMNSTIVYLPFRIVFFIFETENVDRAEEADITFYTGKYVSFHLVSTTLAHSRKFIQSLRTF